MERERAAKSYRLSSFYLGKLFAELPINLISPVIFGIVVYWIIGLNPHPARFFSFLFILIETGFAAIGLGMFITSATGSAQLATALGPLVVVLMILFGGFYINVKSLPIWLSWIQYLSLIRWTYMGFVINQFEGQEFTCDDVAPGQPCTTKGSQAIFNSGFEGERVETAMLVLFFNIVGYNSLAYIALRRNKKVYAKLS